MAKYRKKPVVIEAWTVRELFLAATRQWGNLPEPVAEAYESGNVLFADNPRRLMIKTLEGWMTGELDDHVIMGVKGELYPCKPDIFEATYEIVKDS